MTSLKKRTMYSVRDKLVSDLVETIFSPGLLIDFNYDGINKHSFKRLKLNQIFMSTIIFLIYFLNKFALSKFICSTAICKANCGMLTKEYENDMKKVMNKMHMRYTRHRDEYQ